MLTEHDEDSGPDGLAVYVPEVFFILPCGRRGEIRGTVVFGFRE